jgi:hypothetical protein
VVLLVLGGNIILHRSFSFPRSVRQTRSARLALILLFLYISGLGSYVLRSAAVPVLLAYCSGGSLLWAPGAVLRVQSKASFVLPKDMPPEKELPVPKIIHQTYRDWATIPDEWLTARQSCVDLHSPDGKTPSRCLLKSS